MGLYLLFGAIGFIVGLVIGFAVLDKLEDRFVIRFALSGGEEENRIRLMIFALLTVMSGAGLAGGLVLAQRLIYVYG